MQPTQGTIKGIDVSNMTTEEIYTKDRMLTSGSGPRRILACRSNHFTYYGPVPEGSEVRIGIIKYK